MLSAILQGWEGDEGRSALFVIHQKSSLQAFTAHALVFRAQNTVVM